MQDFERVATETSEAEMSGTSVVWGRTPTLEKKVPKKIRTSELRKTWEKHKANELIDKGNHTIRGLIEYLRHMFEEKIELTPLQVMALFNDIEIDKILRKLKSDFFGLHIYSRTRWSLAARRRLMYKGHAFVEAYRHKLQEIDILPVKQLIRLIKHIDLNLLVWTTLRIGLVALEFIAWLL